MAMNEMSRLRGILLADIKAREQILDILNKLEQTNINNPEYIEELSTKLLDLDKFSTKLQYEAITAELAALSSRVTDLSETVSSNISLESISNYDASKTQILKNVNGTFHWVVEYTAQEHRKNAKKKSKVQFL